jgi:MoaA/NifB/PqqE/SkfB family radical SAM enzyme
MASYFNGNYFVLTNYRGTKLKQVLKAGEEPEAEFPDSIDIKITNSCGWGCPFCHESSHPNGKSFNFKKLTEVLEALPRVPIELAIGGGNVFDIPEKTLKLIRWANKRGFLTRITLNYKDMYHILDYKGPYKKIMKEVGAIGVSIPRYIDKPLHEKPKDNAEWYVGSNLGIQRNCVMHIIVGVYPYEQIPLLNNYEKVLILGYKQWGRAKNSKPKDFEKWRETIKDFILHKKRLGITIGFDNLAIEQIYGDEFDKSSPFYGGNEFSSSMYIDAVGETFAPTSRSPERTKWTDALNIVEYFKNNKNEF